MVFTLLGVTNEPLRANSAGAGRLVFMGRRSR
jgi:hypothetical protein